MDATTSLRTVLILLGTLAVPMGLAAEDARKTKHHHYKLIVLGTLGGPQSYGDAGHGAANITNQGTAAGVADTAIRDPFYPNFNPIFATLLGADPFSYHVFLSKGGALVDLGGLFRGGDSVATFMNENGFVSGENLNGSIDPITGWPASNAVIWKDDRIINLGNLGGYESQGGRVNSRGQVTGFATNSIPDAFSIYYFIFSGGFTNGAQTRAFLWDAKNGMQDIGTLGGSDAFGIFMNERGQIVGFSYKDSTPNLTTGFPTTDPFVWENGHMTDLGTLGGTLGIPNDLNNRGQVVGQSNVLGDVFFHPFLWTAPGPMRDLGTLGGPTGTANAINEAGEVVGFADYSPTPFVGDAFLSRKGKMTDLGALDGDCASGAFGINARSQVTGQSFPCDGRTPHAFLWEDGDMIDLNMFVPPGVEITLTEVEQINDGGEIFGIGTLADGNDRAFFLIPCDEGHPNIGGCDYGPVEVTTVVASHATETQKQLTPQEISRIRDLLMKRHRGFMPRTMH